MSISSKQIGWSPEANILWNIWKQLQQLVQSKNITTTTTTTSP